MSETPGNIIIVIYILFLAVILKITFILSAILNPIFILSSPSSAPSPSPWLSLSPYIILSHTITLTLALILTLTHPHPSPTPIFDLALILISILIFILILMLIIILILSLSLSLIFILIIIVITCKIPARKGFRATLQGSSEQARVQFIYMVLEFRALDLSIAQPNFNAFLIHVYAAEFQNAWIMLPCLLNVSCVIK